MIGLLYALLAVAVGGITFTIIGQLLPRRWFDPEAFPYAAYRWEKNGRAYERIRVHKWKDRMPDLSRIIPGMVKKKASLARTPETMGRLIKETCVAELVHWLLIIAVSPAAAAAIGGIWGVAAGMLYAFCNLLFVIIQRYNRPRLVILHKRMEMRNKKCS